MCCALSPCLLSTFQWPSEDPITHEQNNYSREAETPESVFHHHLPPPSRHLDPSLSSSFTANSTGDATMVKKLNHNASERDRRKKINTLYSSLRSLLPSSDQSKKLSIPSTVSRVLKYIPELQNQVERLIQKKEELLSEMSRQDDLTNQEVTQKNVSTTSSLSSVSANRLSDGELVIQISTYKVHHNPLSEILLNLEEYGLFLINSSSFESFGERIFYNLHLQVEEIHKSVEWEVLSKKLVSLCETREL